MYECENIACPNYVSHSGQYCLACSQARDVETDEFDDDETEL